MYKRICRMKRKKSAKSSYINSVRWSRHVAIMVDSSFPSWVLFSELTLGKRQRGSPLRRYKEQFKETLKTTTLGFKWFQTRAQDHPNWLCSNTIGTKNFEASPHLATEKADIKRLESNDRENRPHPPTWIYT